MRRLTSTRRMALIMGLAALTLITSTAEAQELRPRRRRPILNYFFGRPEYSVYKPVYGSNPPGKITFFSYAGYNYGRRRPRTLVEPAPPAAVIGEPAPIASPLPTVVAPPPPAVGLGGPIDAEPPRP